MKCICTTCLRVESSKLQLSSWNPLPPMDCEVDHKRRESIRTRWRILKTHDWGLNTLDYPSPFTPGTPPPKKKPKKRKKKRKEKRTHIKRGQQKLSKVFIFILFFFWWRRNKNYTRRWSLDIQASKGFTNKLASQRKSKIWNLCFSTRLHEHGHGHGHGHRCGHRDTVIQNMQDTWHNCFLILFVFYNLKINK